jgi:hypothetical protein
LDAWLVVKCTYYSTSNALFKPPIFRSGPTEPSAASRLFDTIAKGRHSEHSVTVAVLNDVVPLTGYTKP